MDIDIRLMRNNCYETNFVAEQTSSRGSLEIYGNEIVAEVSNIMFRLRH